MHFSTQSAISDSCTLACTRAWHVYASFATVLGVSNVAIWAYACVSSGHLNTYTQPKHRTKVRVAINAVLSIYASYYPFICFAYHPILRLFVKGKPAPSTRYFF
jgi:hypothetical protein